METEMDTRIRTRLGRRIVTTVMMFGVLAFGIFLVSRLQPRTTITTQNSPTVIIEPNQYLTTSPNAFDVYRANNADKAIVFLHGGGDTKERVAYNLGLKSTQSNSSYQVANEQLLLDNKVIAVFPQGQAIKLAPNARTWSNYVMTSGEDDMEFLRKLVSYIKTHYHVSHVFLAGHSNGGMMTSRIWCEEPELFDAYIALAGPPSEHFLNHTTPCTPDEIKPYLGIVGSQDNVLQDSNWAAQKWTIDPTLTTSRAFIDPVLIGAQYFLNLQTVSACSEVVDSKNTTTKGVITSWSYCDGMIKLERIESSDHYLQEMGTVSGLNMFQYALDFAAQFTPVHQDPGEVDPTPTQQ